MKNKYYGLYSGWGTGNFEKMFTKKQFEKSHLRKSKLVSSYDDYVNSYKKLIKR